MIPQGLVHQLLRTLKPTGGNAGSFFYVVEPSQYGFTEDRYARMLKPVVYHHKGKYCGYGLKFWPRDAAQLLGEARYRWISDQYK